LEDFQEVINKKSRQWKGTDMAKYLRPETLFGTKFDSYRNEYVSPPLKLSNNYNDALYEPLHGQPPQVSDPESARVIEEAIDNALGGQ